MECPYCKEDLIRGRIVGDRAGLDFFPDGAEKRFFIFPKRVKIKGFSIVI